MMHPLTYVYINEISPFVHRAKYVTIVQFATRASSAFNNFGKTRKVHETEHH